MRRMLIIDDEYLVRIGIKQTIDWALYNIEIVGEATNGQKGLELVKKYNPDIIISDIRMPIMDGLDFMKAIAKEQIDTIVIMLSGYKDFEYAKETLENGAYQYLLKPIDNGKLIDSVLKALEELDKRRLRCKQLLHIEQDLPLITTTIIQKILSGQITDFMEIKEKIKNYNLKIAENGQVIFQIDDNGELSSNIIKEQLQILENMINKKLDSELVVYTYIKYLTHLVYIINRTTDGKILNILKAIIDDFSNFTNHTISVGVSKEYHSINEIFSSYLDAKKNASSKMFLTISTITTDENNALNYHRVVIDGLHYISKNYEKNISVESCCNTLLVSESHLMHVFKKDLGKTFNECLTEYRMIMAKKLLATKKYKVYEVSDMVGFNDTKYFSQVFKKTYGISPIDYLNK